MGRVKALVAAVLVVLTTSGLVPVAPLAGPAPAGAAVDPTPTFDPTDRAAIPADTYTSTAITAAASLPTVPDAPSGVIATRGYQQAMVTWTAPDDGGSPITGYRITPYIGTTAQPVQTFGSTGTGQPVSGLTNGTTYTFRVQAVNAAGVGPASPPSNAVTPAGRASAPTDVVALPGDQQATLSWTAPASDGGTPITGYKVTPYVGSTAQTPRTFAGTATSRTITELTNGTAYSFWVQATTDAGDGDFGFSNTVTPSTTPPWAPFASYDDLVVQVTIRTTGRPPTTAERDAWVRSLQNGSTPAALVTGLRAGSDWPTMVEPVARLYWAYFQRIPDRDGLLYWVAQRRSGRSLRSISEFFARSNEFRVLYGSLSNRQFVELIYENILGRPGEPGGVDYWTGELDTRRRGRGNVMVGFSESNEYQNRMANPVTVVVLYVHLLRRSPTPSELAAEVGLASSTAYVTSLVQRMTPD